MAEALSPTDDELERQQEALQAEARQLLAELRLWELLARAGEPHLIGSAAHGLMVWRDLDVSILCDGVPVEAITAVLAPLAANPRVIRLHYWDETGERSPSGKPGDRRHYVVLYALSSAGAEWKIDLSFWTTAGTRGELAHPEWLAAHLTPVSRRAILRLKHIWQLRPEYPERVGGLDIYRAVLDHGVRSPDELERHLRERGSGTE